MLAVYRLNPDKHKKISSLFDDYKDLNKLIDDKKKIFFEFKDSNLNDSQIKNLKKEIG
jgi:hypothetical protein